MSRGRHFIDRDFWDENLFKDEPFTQREAWLWLISEASFTDRERKIGGILVSTSRGEAAVSSRSCAYRWKWDESRVRRYFSLLKKRRMIETKTDAGVTVVTICNFDHYSPQKGSSDAPTTQQPTHERRGNDAHTKKGKGEEDSLPPVSPSEGERELFTDPPPDPPKTRSKPKRPFPEDWTPSASTVQGLEKQKFDKSFIAQEAEKCRDYHIAKGGKFIDHEAAFRNWMRSPYLKKPETPAQFRPAPQREYIE